MHILLHTCCAVCLIGPYEQLTDEGHEVTGFFFNPNIHPLIEFRRRLKALKVLQERLPVEVIYEEDYGLYQYLEAVDWRSDHRCADCYRLRLDRTARETAERGFDAFTTTLFTSTHQDHETIREVGTRCAEQHGVEFLVRDWRDLAEHNHQQAKKMNLYRQQYCGCIFSENERYKDTTRHLYRGGGS
jgi:hypothetical protein